MSKIADALHDLLHKVAERFEEVGHPAAAELRAIHTRLHTDAATVTGDAAADARHIEADAEHAAGPVVAEAAHDAEHLTAPTTPTAEPPAATPAS
jgi:hypothetical protein